MKLLVRALHAETLKMKRTLALWMVLLAPFVVVLLQFMVLSQRGRVLLRDGDVWRTVISGTYSVWAVLMLPLFITLETALLAGIEHSQKSWKHLYALRIPRSTFYIAKLIAATAIVAGACVVLALGTAGQGLVLARMFPHVKFAAVPWNDLAVGAASMFLSSWLLIALHSWVALRWPSFALACCSGMAATVGTVLVASSERFWKFYPWSLPFHAAQAAQSAQLALTLGAFGGLAIAVIGCWDVTRRDVL